MGVETDDGVGPFRESAKGKTGVEADDCFEVRYGELAEPNTRMTVPRM